MWYVVYEDGTKAAGGFTSFSNAYARGQQMFGPDGEWYILWDDEEA